MGKLGQMGGLMWRGYTESSYGGWEQEKQWGCVFANDKRVKGGTCQSGRLFQAAGSSSWPRRFDWLALLMSARVKVTANLSLSYGFNQNFDEGPGTVHNPCPSLSCLKSIFLAPDRRDSHTALTFSSHVNLEEAVKLNPGATITWELSGIRNIKKKEKVSDEKQVGFSRNRKAKAHIREQYLLKFHYKICVPMPAHSKKVPVQIPVFVEFVCFKVFGFAPTVQKYKCSGFFRRH